jgi:hypothetical protein
MSPAPCALSHYLNAVYFQPSNNIFQELEISDQVLAPILPFFHHGINGKKKFTDLNKTLDNLADST